MCDCLACVYIYAPSICVCECLACVYICAPSMCLMPAEVRTVSGTETTELLYGCWGPLSSAGATTETCLQPFVQLLFSFHIFKTGFLNETLDALELAL